MNKTAPWYQLKALANNKAELRIFGEIGWEVTAQDLIAKLDELGAVDLDVRVNSVGGSVIEGMHIFNRLRLHEGAVAITIEGLAASVATVIACAGKPVKMMDAGWYMIHDPSGLSWGTAEDMRKAAELLDKMRDTIADVYVARTGLDRDAVLQMMDAETWMSPTEARENGFVDEIIEIPQDMAIAAQFRAMDLSKFKHPPALPAESNSGSAGSTGPVTEQPTQPAAPAASNDGDVDMTPEELAEMQAAATEKGRKEEADRRAAVRAVFEGINGFDVASVRDACVDDVACTAETARAKLLDAIKAQNDATVVQHNTIHVTRDARDRTRDGMFQALQARAGLVKDNTRNEFRSMSLREMARMCAVNAGVDLSGKTMLQIVGSAFSHSSSDFPYLLENTLGKVLKEAYMSWEPTWRAWAAVGEVNDFKVNSRIRLGSFNNLQTVPETGEFKELSTGEEKETIQALTKGGIFSLHRQAIINDDLGGFVRIARMLGQSAARTVNADVYGVLTANAAMSDSVAIFHADHNNLAGTGAALSVATLSAAKAAMRKQKFASTDDAYLNIQPDILLVPVALEDTARTLIASETDPGQSNSRKPNIHKDTLTVIADPVLDANSATAWYLLSSRDPIVEAVFLDGVQEPFLDSEEGFTVDGVRWKVRLDYGTDSVDFRGGYKNAGA